jgi:hypothetical protein
VPSKSTSLPVQLPTWMSSEASALKQLKSSASFFGSLTPGVTQVPWTFALSQYSRCPISSEKDTL